VLKYLSSIWVQPETPLLWQEAPHVHADAPDVTQEVPNDLQETSDDPQEDVNNRQGDSQVRQVDIKMAEYSWRDLPFDEEAIAHLLDHFCRRGSEKDPAKPGKKALFQILLKYMVASGDLIIDRLEEGVPILSRGEGNAHFTARHVRATSQQRHGARAHAGGLDHRVTVPVPVSTVPGADTLAARARGGETRQGGVRKVDQDCAGEVAGRGAVGQEEEAGGHCGFQEVQESSAVQGNNGQAVEAPSMPKAVQGQSSAADVFGRTQNTFPIFPKYSSD
jgi:hypothetical protein